MGKERAGAAGEKQIPFDALHSLRAASSTSLPPHGSLRPGMTALVPPIRGSPLFYGTDTAVDAHG